MAGQEDNSNDANSDVKASFAWGQLFVGSILAGFAVYQLGLKAMSMPPSEMLAGFVATYEAVRDFLMLPFDWMDLDLTESEKNLLTVGVVLVGALVRAWFHNPNVAKALLLPASLALNVLVIAVVILLVSFPDPIYSGPRNYLDYVVLVWQMEISDVRLSIVGIFSAIVMVAVIVPIGMSMISDLAFLFPRGSRVPFELAMGKRFSALVFLNVLFVAGCGTFLLLLNWATS